MSNTFNIGDRVTAKGSPFWLTVDRTLPGGYFGCRFGSVGKDAGAWPASELRADGPRICPEPRCGNVIENPGHTLCRACAEDTKGPFEFERSAE